MTRLIHLGGWLLYGGAPPLEVLLVSPLTSQQSEVYHFEPTRSTSFPCNCLRPLSNCRLTSQYLACLSAMSHGGQPISTQSTKNACNPRLRIFLIVASVAKSLSQPGGTRNLNGQSIPLSELLVHQILERTTLDISKRVDFFRWCSLRHNYKHSAGTYSQLLESLCSNSTPNFYDSEHDIFDILASMKRDGYVLDSSTFKLVLDFFVKSRKFDSALRVLDLLGNEVELGPDVYNSVIIALVRNNQLNTAISIFFKILNSQVFENGFVLDANVCNQLLVALRKADMRSEFKAVFGKLREDKRGFPLDVWGYNICIYTLGCWGELVTPLSLFKEMKEKSACCNDGKFNPDLCTYNSLLRVLCLLGKVGDALIVWEELKSSGHEPDAHTYRVVIQGCCKSYRVSDAIKVFNEMQYNGFRPCTIVYNSVLDGLFKARKLLEACHLFEKMVDDRVKASCCTYNIMIDGLFKNGRAQAAYELFVDLKKKGSLVDGITYSIVISHMCREGMLKDALKLAEEMEARGFAVDLVTITSLLVELYRQGRWDLTDRLMKYIRDGELMPSVLKWKANMEASLKAPQSREKDFKPMFPAKGNFSDFQSLLNSDISGSLDTSFGDVDEWSSSPYLDRLADRVKTSNHLLSLSRGKRVQVKSSDSFDIDMINTFLSIFLAKGRLSTACKLFEIFSSMGVDPTSYTYNSFMSSFVKKGYFNEAYGILQEMGEKVCPSDIATYSLIIQALGKMGRADIATAISHKLTEGSYLDIVMYNTLINALGKAGRFDEVSRLFQQMRTSGINPDVVTYNTLIEVHSKAGRLKEAHEFLKAMLDAGCAPNHVTDTTLEFLYKEIEKQRRHEELTKHPKKDDFS